MILETTEEDYSCLIQGRAPREFRLADTPVAPPEVMEMLADVATRVRALFAPASWLIVEEDEVVGMCSVTRPPEDGVVDIGYGIAPSRHGRGIAGRAIGDIVRWAASRPDVSALTAETAVGNIPSQHVLIRNGFQVVGERIDDEDGRLTCWRNDLR